jgi:AraC-like DNA-binding protein
MDYLEQRSVIKFFFDEGETAIQIQRRLFRHYGDRAYCHKTVCYWIKELRFRTTDLHNVRTSGRPPDESLCDVIARTHEQDPHLSARKVAAALRISPATVCHYLGDVLGLRLCHLR